jgi:hypothetical protein
MPAPERPFSDAVRFRREEGLEEIPHRHRVALYRAGMDTAMVLNRVGSLLWKQFASPQTAATLVAHLAAAFPSIPPDRLAEDVHNYLDLLWKRGIIAPIEE